MTDTHIHVCTSSDLHPYECGQACIHCKKELTDNHDPDYCWLCHNGPPPKEMPE